MMHQRAEAASWPRFVLVLVATLALALATMPAALAQDDEEEADTGVACDADVFADEEGLDIYLVGAGQTVECEAWGLEPEADTEWLVEYFDAFEEDEEPVGDEGGVESADEDGVLLFAFTTPDDIVIGFFQGFVAQPPEVEEVDYLEEFFGFILGLGPMVCEPDPVTEGESVECVAEEMAPDEDFEWAVQFMTFDDLFEFVEEDDGDFEDVVEPDIQGTGTADADGVGAFEFEVPAGGDFELYLAVAAQEDYLAVYPGEIEPAPPAPAPEPQPEPEAEAPVAVPQPTRVDTGAGGSAGSTGVIELLLLALGLAGALALASRRHATGSR